MADLSKMHYEPRRAVDTLKAAMTLLLERWYDLPEAARSELDQKRTELVTNLKAANDFQRGKVITDFLTDLESSPAVLTLAFDVLKTGKSTMTSRGLVMIKAENLGEITDLLQAPLPEAPTGSQDGSARAKVTEIEFVSVVSSPMEIPQGGSNYVIVRLSRSEPKATGFSERNPGMATKIAIPFTDLEKPVAVRVTLDGPGLSETTGDWSRTMQVFSHRDSEPVIFLLDVDGTGAVGPRYMNIHYASPLGADATVTQVVEPAIEAFRGVGKGVGETTVGFFTDVRFPAQVKPQTITPLWIRLTQEQSDASRSSGIIGIGFEDMDKPEQIQVVVHADGFTEITDVLSRTMMVYSFADSQPVVFLLKSGRDLGEKAISVDFYHHGRQIGSAEFTAEITPKAKVEQPDQKSKLTREPAFSSFPKTRILPADVELRIIKSAESGSFRYMLHSSVAAVNRHFAEMGQMPLSGAADPRAYLSTQFHDLSTWAAASAWQPDNADHQQVVQKLETMGERLFEDLFSPELKEAYWALMDLREQGIIQSLLITSDEPWIPWELVKPFDQRKGKSDDFLAGGWQLSRWLSGPGLGDMLNVKSVRAVIPQLDLPFTAKERNYITDLGRQGVEIGTFLRSKQDVTHAVRAGKIQVIHVAAHGDFKSERPDESPITLQDGDELYPQDMRGSHISALTAERPLLFLNACHSAQVGFSLTGLGGWAQTAVQHMRVSAFIGGLWEVNDELASEMAVQFYENLRRDMPLGEAFHKARTFIRNENPGNSTWLAYSLYGDPNMRVTWV
jgi:hypothetical protein